MTWSSWSLVATTVLSFAAAPIAPRGEPTDGEVRAVSLRPAAGGAELAINVQGAVSVTDMTLSDPARIVLDLEGASLPSDLRNDYDGVNRAGVVGMRVRQFDENTVRVVLVMDRLKPYTVTREDDGIHVAFGADEKFTAWSTGSLPASVVAAARAEARTEPAAAPASERTLSRAGRTSIFSPEQQRQEPRLTVSWDNASIQDVVAGFQAISGRSIILGKNIDARITAEIRDKPWPDAFKAILGAYGLSVQEVEGGILRVDAPETLAAIDSLEPRETAVVKINYASAGDLIGTVQGVLSKRASVVADTGTNSLIITESRSQIPGLVDFVRGLDIKPPQVAIQAKMIFVDRTDVEQLGFKYDLASGSQFYNKIVQRPNPNQDGEPYEPGINVVDLGGNAISAIANADAIVSSSALDLTYSIALGGFTLSSFLSALERIDLTDVQTEPVITTKDNKKATIVVGEEVPVRVIDASSLGGAAGQAPRATVQFKEVGIKLNVTPHVTNNRQVVLDIETERSAVKTLSAADLGFSIDKQFTKNEILVSDGETAVIGGLTVTTVTRSKTGIPLLGSLPIIGSLFSFTSNTENRKDLIILVTPRIIDDQASEN
ncbi:MAG: AMIN domain-containing protein [Gemmatimonadales bacterium]